MSCELFKKALIEAAALGQREEELAPKVREHVKACGDCQLVLAAQQSLHFAIEESLKRRVRIDAPASFALRMRSRIAERRTTDDTRWLRWVAVAAVVAMVLGGALLRGNLHHVAAPIATTVSPRADANVANVAPDAKRAAPSADPVKARVRSLRVASPAVDEEEQKPLVSNDQREVVELLVQRVRRGEVDGRILKWDAQPSEPKDLQIAPIEIGTLSLSPAASDSDTILFDSSRATDRRTE